MFVITLESHLKLNKEKAEFLDIGTRQQLDKVSLDEMTIGHSQVKTTSTVRSLGVWFDRDMKFDTTITKMCAMGHFYLYNIRRIRKHLIHQSARTLTQATIIARLDYCNSLLYGCTAMPPLCFYTSEFFKTEIAQAASLSAISTF